MPVTRREAENLRKFVPGLPETEIQDILFGAALRNRVESSSESEFDYSAFDTAASNIFSSTIREITEDTIRLIEESENFCNEKSSDSTSSKLNLKMAQRAMHPTEIKALIPAFDGKSMSPDKWIAKVEALQAIYKWKDEELMLYAAMCLTGAPRLWYLPEEIEKWDDFKEQLKETFKIEVNQADIHSRLMKMEREKDEAYDVYAFRVRNVGKPYGVDDNSLISYVIRGLSSEEIYTALYNRSYDDFNNFVKAIRDTQINLNLKKLTLKSGNSSKAYTENAPSYKKGEAEKAKRSGIICYNCNEKGHKSNNCPTKPIKKPTCGKCGLYGHKDEDCRVKKVAHHIQNALKAEVEKKDPEEVNPVLNVNENGVLPVKVMLDDQLKQFNALMDLGSPVSTIKETLVKNIKLSDCIESDIFFGINNSPLELLGRLETYIFVKNEAFKVCFLVVRDSAVAFDILLGREFLREHNFAQIKLNFDKGNSSGSFDVSLMNEVIGSKAEVINVISSETRKIEFDIGDSPETLARKSEIEGAVYDNYLNREKPSHPLVTHEITIKLKEDKVFNVNPRRLSPLERRELERQVNDLLEMGVIRESHSEYSSRVVFVKKKDSSLRMCVDYRPLNKLIVRHHFPTPIAEDEIQKFYNKRYFSCLDFKNGFYHVDIAEDSKKYTSFITEMGQHEFNKLPFGYADGPEEFIRYVHKVLKDFIKRKVVVAFFDDLGLGTYTIEEHVELLSELLQVLADNHIKLNFAKCQFLKTRIEFLGYEIEFNKINPSNRHIASVQNYPVPVDVRSLQRFVGFVSYFRKFILDFHKIALPLYDLLKNGSEFKFEKKHFEAFEKLRAILLSKPVLCIYSPDAETELHTDASAIGFGAILLQKQRFDDKLHPVMYFSRKTTDSESKLHSFELETLAVYYSLQRFRQFLLGLHFRIVTDCNSLAMTLKKCEVSRKIAGWVSFINDFDYEVVHRAGVGMQHVDALSRITIHAVSGLDEDVQNKNLFVNQIKDKRISQMKEKILKGELAGYEVRDNLVYKQEGKRLLLLIPEIMITSVLYRFHDDVGHFGIDKTCHLIRRSFYFHNMRQLVAEHVKKCVVCIMHNPKHTNYDGKLKIFEKKSIPFDTWHIDHVGPLEITPQKNLHILAAVDGFTKMIKLFPTKSTSTKEVVKHLENCISDYSCPRRIVSDRGTAFTSNEFKKFVDNKGIVHVLNATSSPQSNGQVERYNRTLIPLIRKLVEVKKKAWDLLLKDAEYLLNNTINRSLGDTPYRVLYGVDQRRKIEPDLIQYCLDLNEANEIDLEEIRDKAAQKTKKLQIYNKEMYDKKCRKSTHYKIGDLVVVPYKPKVGESSKLSYQYRGPYEVRKLLGNDRYLIGDVQGYQVSNIPFEGVFDPRNMRLYSETIETNKDQEGETDSDDSITYEDVEYLEEVDTDLDQ